MNHTVSKWSNRIYGGSGRVVWALAIEYLMDTANIARSSPTLYLCPPKMSSSHHRTYTNRAFSNFTPRACSNEAENTQIYVINRWNLPTSFESMNLSKGKIIEFYRIKKAFLTFQSFFWMEGLWLGLSWLSCTDAWSEGIVPRFSLGVQNPGKPLFYHGSLFRLWDRLVNTTAMFPFCASATRSGRPKEAFLWKECLWTVVASVYKVSTPLFHLFQVCWGCWNAEIWRLELCNVGASRSNHLLSCHLKHLAKWIITLRLR